MMEYSELLAVESNGTGKKLIQFLPFNAEMSILAESPITLKLF